MKNMEKTQRLFHALPVLNAGIDEGLSPADVKLRQSNGLSNRATESGTKSEKQIVKENIFTFFNLIFIVLGLALLLVGSFENMLFLGIAIANTAIGIFQELKAKRAVDKLTVVAAGQVKVIRAGQRMLVRSDLLVRDDIVLFSAGDQIVADAVLRSGQMQVNESLLTGEADAIIKNPGDVLRSGSFVISGNCRAQLTSVGAESYAAKLALEAKRNTRSTKSEMMTSLSKLITVVGIALVPLGILLFLRQYLPNYLDQGLQKSVVSTVGALTGMIPEGLYLLTSVAIAASCLKLSRGRVLVQDMNCIETLAHVDILCVDKTGTITEPSMEVSDIFPLCTDRYSYEAIEKILGAFYCGEEPDNETARAMAEQFATATQWRAVKRIPFSSSTKWSAADFGENGRYIIGAPEFVMGDRYDSIRGNAEPWSARGCRVLLLAAYDMPFADARLETAQLTPIALIFLSNLLRPDAEKTFRYFAAQGVSVRVISGDNPLTVSQVADRAGIENADKYVDATTLRTPRDYTEAIRNYTVFGRVTPEQKRRLIQEFKRQGHTVAMTGDGVNDVLALKDADCGIAMASGSQAASQVAQIVLLNSDFKSMPAIVAEGRRVINNIQRAASLFLVKNIFSFVFAAILLFVAFPYPIEPIHLTLISSLTIGIPAFFLALEPNYARVTGKFMRNVIRRALPGGLTNIALVMLAGILTTVLKLPTEHYTTIAVWILSAVGLVTLYYVSTPFTRLRLLVFAAVSAAMLVCLLFFYESFNTPRINLKSGLILVTLLLSAPTVLRFFRTLFDRQVKKNDSKTGKKKGRKKR
ncbi:MAG: cation-translocating P-type ATPase [Oscillospiraceae bacterium]|jgi:cation-transporting ATPase E|nr:cation-translocating P-type ATPase [Oscillospiraceae bacterium]